MSNSLEAFSSFSGSIDGKQIPQHIEVLYETVIIMVHYQLDASREFCFWFVKSLRICHLS